MAPSFFGTRIERINSMSVLVRDFDEYLGNDCFKVWSDFDHYVTADTFTTTASNSGAAAVQDAAGGVLKITPSDATQVDNDETYVHSTHEMFKFATDKPLIFAARVRPVSNTIGSSNFIVGLKDAVAADSILDDGSGPAASYSGALFFAKDGGTTWWCESSIAGTQTTVDSGITVGNNAWDTLIIKTIPRSSTVTEVHFLIADGDVQPTEKGFTTPSGTQQFVAQTVTHTNATEMEICFGVKSGAANLTDYLDVDWVYCAQKR
jgi:hypothetical protein